MNKEQIIRILNKEYTDNLELILHWSFKWHKAILNKCILEDILPNILKDIVDWDIKNILENLKNRDSKDYEFAWKNQETYDKGQIDAYTLVLEKIKQKAKKDFWIEI